MRLIVMVTAMMAVTAAMAMRVICLSTRRAVNPDPCSPRARRADPAITTCRQQPDLLPMSHVPTSGRRPAEHIEQESRSADHPARLVLFSSRQPRNLPR